MKHEEYYSFTHIRYKESEKSLQITMKLFINDVEAAMKKNYDKNFELNSDREPENSDELVDQYLRTKFTVTVDGKIQNYQWIGKEYNKDMVYIYLDISDLEKFQSLQIQNTMIMDVYSIQENIVKITAFGQEKSMILTINSESGVVRF